MTATTQLEHWETLGPFERMVRQWFSLEPEHGSEFGPHDLEQFAFGQRQ